MRANTVSYSIRCLLQKCPTPAAMTSCNPDRGQTGCSTLPTGREGAALLVLFVKVTSTPLPLKRHTLTKKYWCSSNALTSLSKVSVRKTNVSSNMRSDFFNKHPEVIHQTQVTFLHKQFIKNGERISKSINNSRAPSIRILRGPWTVRINRRVELVLTGPCYMKSKIQFC